MAEQSTNDSLDRFTTSIHTEALRQSEQIIRQAIGKNTEEIAPQSVTQATIAIIELFENLLQKVYPPLN